MKSQTSAVHAATALRPGAVRDAIVDRLERSLGKPLAERDPARHLRRAVASRCARNSPRAGSRRSAAWRARASSACATSRWNSCSAAASSTRCPRFDDELARGGARDASSRWATTSIASPPRKRIPGSATAASAGSPRASSIRSRRSAMRRPATASATTTASSRRSSTQDGAQREVASTWLGCTTSGKAATAARAIVVRFGGRCQATHDEQGRVRYELGRDAGRLGRRLRPADPGQSQPDGESPAPVVGTRRSRRSTSRSSTPATTTAAVAEQVDAKNLSRVLYPDDSTPQGKELRFKQQYFFVSAIAAGHPRAASRRERRQLEDLPQRDRDPAQRHASGARDPRADAPAGRRVRHGVGRRVGDHCGDVFGYTNHTLLPEALETWPVAFFERLLPRHLQIIYQINRDFLRERRARAIRTTCERRRRMSLIDEDDGRRVRMAHLAVVGSHIGQRRREAAFASSCAKTIFADFAQLWPERFTNVTNGIAVRRWLKQSNPRLVAAAHRAARLGLGKRSRGARAAALGGGRCRVPRSASATIKRANKDRAREDDPPAHRRRRQRRLAVRRAGQAHPRVQAPAAEPAVRDHALQLRIKATTRRALACRAR